MHMDARKREDGNVEAKAARLCAGLATTALGGRREGHRTQHRGGCNIQHSGGCKSPPHVLDLCRIMGRCPSQSKEMSNVM